MNRPAGFFNRKVRGFRVVELIGGGFLTVVVVALYLAKAGAGAEAGRIADTDRAILNEQRRVRALKAELAYLERPERLERLSRAYLGLQPVSARHETPADALPEVARREEAASSAPGPTPGGVAAPDRPR